MLCCIAAVAVLAVFSKVVRRPLSWLRGRDSAPSQSAMPPPARFDVRRDEAATVGAR